MNVIIIQLFPRSSYGGFEKTFDKEQNNLDNKQKLKACTREISRIFYMKIIFKHYFFISVSILKIVHLYQSKHNAICNIDSKALKTVSCHPYSTLRGTSNATLTFLGITQNSNARSS